jgi:hypothetical protein
MKAIPEDGEPSSSSPFRRNDGSLNIPDKDKLWSFIVEEGKKKDHKLIINTLDEDDLRTLLATMEFFGASELWIRQTAYDITLPKFRVFDWLAMCVSGRAYGYQDGDNKSNRMPLQVLVYAWLDAEGDQHKFIENMREHDYDVELEWEQIELP